MQQISMNFDATEKAAKESSEPKVLSVSDVNKAIRGTLETQYKLLWIQGEISNFKAHSSGHHYFSLKDSKAQISAVMFRGFNQNLKFKPHDGLEVIVRGKITVYEPRGNYQVFCELMEPVGAGALQMAFEQLKRKLEAEGLFAIEKKRPLPALPQHVAVVTSPTGAAIRDILNVLGRRFRGLRVTVVPALVQGNGAAESVCKALALAQKLEDVDVIICGRGGGSIEDMWCFNEESVARAIANCRVPIISAVGHEIDFTIADFVADLRAPTPSAAAELVVKNAAEIMDTIQKLTAALNRCWQHDFTLRRQQLAHFAKRLVDPKRRLQDLVLRNDEFSQRLELAMSRHLERLEQKVQLLLSRMPSPREQILRRMQEVQMQATRLEAHWARAMESYRSRLEKFVSLLESFSPLKVLGRGYSIVKKNEKVVTDVKELKAGDAVSIRLFKGEAQAKIESIVNKE